MKKISNDNICSAEQVISRIRKAYSVPDKWGWQASLAKKLDVEPPVISGWKKRGVPERIISRTILDTGCEEVWLVMGEGEMFITAHHGHNAQFDNSEARERQDHYGFDRDTMVTVIKIFEEELNRKNSPRDPEKIAEAMVMAYEQFIQDGEIDQEKLGRIIRLVI